MPAFHMPVLLLMINGIITLPKQLCVVLIVILLSSLRVQVAQVFHDFHFDFCPLGLQLHACKPAVISVRFSHDFKVILFRTYDENSIILVYKTYVHPLIQNLCSFNEISQKFQRYHTQIVLTLQRERDKSCKKTRQCKLALKLWRTRFIPSVDHGDALIHQQSFKRAITNKYFIGLVLLLHVYGP